VLLPQRGTVVASGIDLAFLLTEGGVYTAGFDLSHIDILTHTRPYRFDDDMLLRSIRTNVYYNQKFKRAYSISKTESGKIYSQWFEKQKSYYPRPVTTIDCFDKSANLNFSMLPFSNFIIETKYIAVTNPVAKIINTISGALLNSHMKDPLKKEIIDLLFPHNKDTSCTDLIAEMENIAKPYLAAEKNE
jgi:hypothetical protein